MNHLSVTCLISFTMLLGACTVIQKPDIAFRQVLNNTDSTKNRRIQFEGAYHNNLKTSYYLERPIYFLENGLVFYDGVSERTLLEVEYWKQIFATDKKTWGGYEIIGDTLKVKTYCAFYDNTTHYLIANFQGIIKNQDTITGWHMVEPYPKLNKRLIEYYDFLFKERKDLYFKPLPIKPFMDSVAHKAWVE